jgi:outer membrane immunogenic protein
MKRLLLAGTALAVLLGGSAMAADLAVRTPPPVYRPVPVVVPVFTWTGCYVGANGGGVWVNKDYSLTGVFPGVGYAPFVPAGADLGSHTASGGIGGLQAGCNYQAGGFVVGIQGDYDWMSASASHVDPFLAGTSLSSNSKSLASVTGRVGYAWDRFLGYVKAGGAWEKDDYTIAGPAAFLLTPITPIPFGVATASETRGGWTVGIGAEYAFTNWLTGFVEYDYYGFGTKTVNFVAPVAPAGFANVDIKENKNVVKAGLNVKFGPGLGWW